MNEPLQNIIIINIALLVPVILFYFIDNTEINSLVGYRTKRSMKNQQNWRLAQRTFNKNWIYVVPVMLLVQLALYFLAMQTYIVPVSLVLYIAYIIALIIVVEQKLIKFEKEQHIKK